MKQLAGLAFIAAIGICPIWSQQERGDKEIAFQGTVTVPFQNASDGTLGILVPRFGYFLTRRNFLGIENNNFFAKGFQSSGVSLLYRFYMGAKGSKFQPYVGIAPGVSLVRTDVGVQSALNQASITAAQQQINAVTNAAQRTALLNLFNAGIDAFRSGCLLQGSSTGFTSCTPIPSSSRRVSTRDFQGAGEFGLKYYLSRKFAFETSYRLNYLRASSPYAKDLYDVKSAIVATSTNTSVTNTFTKTGQRDGQTGSGGGFKSNASNLLMFGFSYVF